MMQAWEVVAMVLNLAFTGLIAWEKRIGWLLGFVAGIISVWLYAESRTWALCSLNVYYVIMAVYGWWAWGRPAQEQPVRWAPRGINALAIALCVVVTGAVAWSLRSWFDGTYPYVDAFVSVFSLAATWMMTRKYIDNWIWFLVADSVGIWLNWRIGYHFFAVQYLVYLGLSTMGLIRWRRALLTA